MVIAIDARPLLKTPRTGVAILTETLLNELFEAHPEQEFVLFANAFHIPKNLPFQDNAQVHWVLSRIPNKLFHTLIWLFRRPRLDLFVGKKINKKIDVWFAPNLHFTALSAQVRFFLCIHDVSFQHFTEFYSQKGRLWHRAVDSRRQVSEATHSGAISSYQA